MIRWLFEVSNTQVWQCSSRDWGRPCAHLWWGGGWCLVLVGSGHVFIRWLWVTGYIHYTSIQDRESIKKTWEKFRKILNLPRPSHSPCVPRINDFLNLPGKYGERKQANTLGTKMKKYILVVILKCTDSWFSCSLTFELRGCACKDLKTRSFSSSCSSLARPPRWTSPSRRTSAA